MYTSIGNLLKVASKNHFGIIACSPLNMEMARGIISAASDMNAPIILLLGQNMMRQHAKAELIIPMIQTLAEYSAVPVATCLDHGNDSERIMYAFRNGFSSIMFDGSLKPLEENIRETRKIVDLCHQFHMCVEGELGHVGMAAQNDGLDGSLYTDPQEAKRFVEETQVDCLAIAVGTAHGEYPKGRIPEINFQRIKEIKELLPDVPLALHGGSGSGDENILKAVDAGMNKINVVTDFFLACRDYLKKTLDDNPKTNFIDLMSGMEKAVYGAVCHWIELSGSKNTAHLFRPENRMKELIFVPKRGNEE